MPIVVDQATGLLQKDTGLLPLYDRWLAESLAVLKDFFSKEGHRITVVDPAPLDMDACWRAPGPWAQGLR